MNPVPGSVNRASKFRGETDFYATPPGATQALCSLGILPRVIWEPACGDGALAEVLKANGHEVIATDLVDRGYGIGGLDFLLSGGVEGATAIVTNPPFNIADDFIDHALSLRPDIACFLLRLKYLEGSKRFKRIYARRQLAAVHVFIERVKFFSGEADRTAQPGWNTEAFAWFVWRPRVSAPLAPTIDWISRDATGGVFT